jgi:hypothetical protein
MQRTVRGRHGDAEDEVKDLHSKHEIPIASKQGCRDRNKFIGCVLTPAVLPRG